MNKEVGENNWGNRWGEAPYNVVMKVHLNEIACLFPPMFIMTAPSDIAEMGAYYHMHTVLQRTCGSAQKT